MRSDRRTTRWLNALCASTALGTVAATAVLATRARAAERPSPLPPSLQQARAALRAARAAWRDGRFSEAERRYRQALRDRPGSRSITLETARFYDERHESAQALRLYRSVLGPEIREARVPAEASADLARYGELCLRAGETERGRDAFRIAVRHAPRWIPRNDALSLEALRAKALLAAQGTAALPGVIALDGTNWEARRAYVALLASQSERTRALEALKAFRKAVERAPGDASGHAAYGTALFEEGRPQGGIAYLRASLPQVSAGSRETIARRIRNLEALAHSVFARRATQEFTGEDGTSLLDGGPTPLLRDE